MALVALEKDTHPFFPLPPSPFPASLSPLVSGFFGAGLPRPPSQDSLDRRLALCPCCPCWLRFPALTQELLNGQRFALAKSFARDETRATQRISQAAHLGPCRCGELICTKLRGRKLTQNELGLVSPRSFRGERRKQVKLPHTTQFLKSSPDQTLWPRR